MEFGSTISNYIVPFSSWTMMILFSWSAISKLWNFSQFTQALNDFRLVRPRLVLVAAIMTTTTELMAALLLLSGGEKLVAGLALSASALVVFTLALMSVIRRRLHTPCGCFGVSQHAITAFDVYRNIGFIFIALAGLVAQWHPVHISYPNNGEQTILVLIAIIVITILTRLEDIASIFTSPSKPSDH